MTKPLDPELLVYGIVRAAEPQISPDGSRIVYTRTAVDGETRRGTSEVWTCLIDGAEPHRLIMGRHARGARWSPDGSRISFVGSDGDESVLYVAPIDDPASLRELTRQPGGIEGLAWSPDGARLAYTGPDGPESLGVEPSSFRSSPPVRVVRRMDFKADGRGFVGDRRDQVFVVDVATGELRRVTRDPFDHTSPQWSPDSHRLAVRLARGDRGALELAVVDLVADEVTTVSQPGGRVDTWAWSPTGDRILFSDDPGHTLQPDYFVVAPATGTIRRLTEDLLSVPEAAPAHPVWLDERQALVHVTREGGSGLELVDTATGETELVQRWQARNAGLSTDRGRRFVVQAHTSLGSVGEIAVHDRETSETRVVTELNAELLADHVPANWERLEVTRGDVTIEAWLLLPPEFDRARRYPVVLDVHGGPTANYGYGFMAHQQCLATNGFLVLYPNPRGSSSYGRHFARQNIRDWGGEDYSDVLAALDAVLERPYADSERTGIFGISYGGYLTAWAIGQSNRFKAAVCGSPIFDLESDYGTSDVAHNGLERFAGGPPHAEREWYAAHSPSTFAHQTRTPTLIFHGEADERCPIGQSEQMFVALVKAGCEVEYVRYPGASHMFFATGLPEHRADWLARVLAWFEQHLGEPSSHT